MCVFVAGWWGARSLRYFYFFFNFLCDENDEEYIYEKILNGIKEEKDEVYAELPKESDRLQKKLCFNISSSK